MDGWMNGPLWYITGGRKVIPPKDVALFGVLLMEGSNFVFRSTINIAVVMWTFLVNKVVLICVFGRIHTDFSPVWKKSSHSQVSLPTQSCLAKKLNQAQLFLQHNITQRLRRPITCMQSHIPGGLQDMWIHSDISSTEVMDPFLDKKLSVLLPGLGWKND